MPDGWRDDALAAKWDDIRALRRRVTVPLEDARRAGAIGASLQAQVVLPLSAAEMALLTAEEWAELAIVSELAIVYDPQRDGGVLDGEHQAVTVERAAGEKCARCWRVLPEVGQGATRAPLCLRCEGAVSAA